MKSLAQTQILLQNVWADNYHQFGEFVPDNSSFNFPASQDLFTRNLDLSRLPAGNGMINSKAPEFEGNKNNLLISRNHFNPRYPRVLKTSICTSENCNLARKMQLQRSLLFCPFLHADFRFEASLFLHVATFRNCSRVNVLITSKTGSFQIIQPLQTLLRQPFPRKRTAPLFTAAESPPS